MSRERAGPGSKPSRQSEDYARHFGTHRPARSTVAVAGLPKGARVEIDVVAVR